MRLLRYAALCPSGSVESPSANETRPNEKLKFVEKLLRKFIEFHIPCGKLC